jgi:hypothetical protein
MRLRIVTVLWGSEFVDRLLNLTLRSLAAAGNIPDLARRHAVSYELYAPEQDIKRIASASLYGELAKRIELRCRPVALSDADAADAMSHWTVWHSAVAAARRDDVPIILVAPDHVFCRGTMLRWAELFEQGYLAIFSPGVQVAIETLTLELASRFPSGRPIDLSPVELRAVMFRHLHPIKIAMLRGNPRSIGHPEWHLRAVPGRGFVQNVLASHAVAFHPGRIRMSENLCPTEQFERVAFEPSWFLGGEPLLKHLGLYLRPRPFDDATLSHYGAWGDRFTLAVNLLESRTTHVYAIDSLLPQDAERRQRRAAEFFVGQMQASRSIVRLWQGLRDAGLYHAARWLAAAHMGARLRRRLPVKPPITLLVPGDEVLARLDPPEAERLLARDGDGLVSILRAHVIAGWFAFKPGDRLAQSSGGPIGSLGGQRFVVDRNGSVRIRRGPIRVDEIEVYVIDHSLVPLPLRRPSGPFAAIRRAFDHGRRRGARKVRDVALALFRRDRRLLMFVLRLREATRMGWQAAKHAVAGTQSSPGLPRAATPVDPQAIECFRRAVAARGLDAINEMYAFYSAQVLEGSPLAAAPAARLAEVPRASLCEIANWLERAVERSPAFTEAWLELGRLRRDAGDESRAVEAFSHAQIGTPLLWPLGQPDPRAIAATERARVLERRGRPAEALTQLESVVERRWLPWTHHLLRARLLLTAGRAPEALIAFEQCMEWTSIESLLDVPLPHGLEELKELLDHRPDRSTAQVDPLTA